MVYLKDVHARLRAMFTPQEFEQWLALRESMASNLIGDMPSAALSTNAYFAAVIPKLYARGMFASHGFYCDLLVARPRRAADVAAIAELFGQTHAAAIAWELAGQPTVVQAPAIVVRSGLPQAVRVRHLGFMVRRRTAMRMNDPRRKWCDEKLARLSQAILAEPAPAGRPHGFVSRSLVSRCVAYLQMLSKILLASVCVGASLLMVVHGSWQQYTREQPALAESSVEVVRADTPTHVRTTARAAVAELPERVVSREPATPRAKLRVARRAPAPPVTALARFSEGPEAAPDRPARHLAGAGLSTRLAADVVEARLRALIPDGSHAELSLRVVVCPDGTVDRPGLAISSVYGDAALADAIGALRFPATHVGSGEVFCAVVSEPNPDTGRLDGRVQSLKCEGR